MMKSSCKWITILVCGFFCGGSPTVLALSVAEQAEVFFTRGKAAQERGDFDVARICYELVLRAQPDHKGALERVKTMNRDDEGKKSIPAVPSGTNVTPVRPAAAAIPQARTPASPTQPAQFPPPAPTGPPAWKSKDGKSVQGEFVGLDGEAVVIKRDGKEVTISFSRLDPASVAQARDFAAVKSDILLHYDFSDGSGAVVKDRSGNRRDGTLAGFANMEPGAGDTGAASGWTKNGSLIFDGVDDQVVTPLMLADLAGTKGFTIEAVVGHRNIENSYSVIVGTDAASAMASGVVQIGKGSNRSIVGPRSALFARLNGLSLPVVESKKPSALGDGALHHVALVYDAVAGEVILYFDHQLQGQWNQLKGSPSTGNRIILGKVPWSTMEAWFGPISEVRITKRPLVPGQFLPTPSPIDRNPPKPAHQYSFNNDANDSIGGSHGKVVDAGGPTARFTNGQLDLSGNRGEASNAITEDAYVDLPNGLIGKHKGRFTLELWCTMTRWEGWITACMFGRSAGGEDISDNSEEPPYAAANLVLRGLDNDLQSTVHVADPTRPDGGRNTANAGFDVPQVGTERHYTLVIDVADTKSGANGSQHLYLDGYPVASAPLPPGVVGKLDDINNWLGRSHRIRSTFVGRYNEFRIYDRPLTAAEVLSSHIAGPDVYYQAASQATPKR